MYTQYTVHLDLTNRDVNLQRIEQKNFLEDSLYAVITP